MKAKAFFLCELLVIALVACAAPSPTATPIPPTPTPIPPTATPIPPTATFTPTLTPTLTATPTPALPKAGDWNATSETLGDLVFNVSADAKEITLVSVNFVGFTCQGKGIKGKWQPSEFGGVITNKQFTFGGVLAGYMELTMTGMSPGVTRFPEFNFSGKFDDTGTQMSGTWKADWAGATCSGNWRSTGNITAKTTTAATPPATTRPTVGLTDSFDNNKNDWFEGDYADQFVIGKRSITNGKYRWEVQAVQPMRFSAVPRMDSFTDFFLTVEARRVSGATNAAYGLLFRRLDRSNFFLFRINDDGYYSVELLQQENWTTLIDWTRSSAIRPNAVNKLTVSAQGVHFKFYINDQLVGETNSSVFPDGVAGLVVGLFDAGDQAVFEFDNFAISTEQVTPSTVREPTAPKLCANGAPLGTWMLIVNKTSPGDGTITIDGEAKPIRSGRNVFFLSIGKSHPVLVGTNTINLSGPECGENTLNVP